MQHLNLTVDELVDPAGERAGAPEPKRGRPPLSSGNGGSVAGEPPAPQKLISAPLVQLGETRGTLKLEGGIAWERLSPCDVPAVGVRMVHAPFGSPE